MPERIGRKSTKKSILSAAHTFTYSLPRRTSSRFSGFKSRCIIPRRCRNANASSTCKIICKRAEKDVPARHHSKCIASPLPVAHFARKIRVHAHTYRDGPSKHVFFDSAAPLPPKPTRCIARTTFKRHGKVLSPVDRWRKHVGCMYGTES